MKAKICEKFISVGIDVGADFSLMSIALPDSQLLGRPYRILHSSVESIEGAIHRIRSVELDYDLKVRIFMESTGIYHCPLYYRFKESGFDVFVINPIITHASQNMNVRNVHNDKFDSQKIALIGLSPNLKVSIVPDDFVAGVKSLLREYHSLKKELSQYICRLKLQLRQTFPQYLKLFSKVNTITSLEILSHYSSPNSILSADKETLISLIQSSAHKGRKTAEQKYTLLCQAANDAEYFGHGNDGNYILISHYVEMIRILTAQTESLLDKVKCILADNPESSLARQIDLIQSIPGAGFITAATIACEIGDFTQFRRPKQLYAYFGLDPKVRQSGNYNGNEQHISKRGSSFARRAIYMMTIQSISNNKSGVPKNAVLRDYYIQKCISKPKMTAVGAVMHKLCNIIFAVLRDEAPFKIITPDEHRRNHSQIVMTAA